MRSAGLRAVAALAVAVMVAGACGPEVTSPSPTAHPASPQPSQAQPTSAATAMPSPIASLPTTTRFGTWTEVPMPIAAPGIFGGNAPDDVAVFGRLLVAVGGVNGGCCDASFSTDTRALVWTSKNGMSWRLVPDTDAFDLGHMRAVASGPGSVVTVGTRNEESSVEPGSIEYEPMVWISSDGRRWSVAAGAPALVDVAFLGDAFIGLASDAEGSSIWRSVTGRDWHVVETRNAAVRGLEERLVATPNGAFLLGRAALEDPQPVAALWWSPDGLDWVIVEDANLHGVEVEDVAWFAGRFVAVGWAIDPLDGGDVAVIAISEDGVAWERLPATAFPPPGRALGRAVALDDGILVLGSEADADGEASIGAAWVSTDGLRWQQVAASSALPSTLDMGGPVRFGDGLVAVGRGRGPEGETFGPVSWLIR